MLSSRAGQTSQCWGLGMLWGEDPPVWQGRPEREGGGSRPHWSLGQHLAPSLLWPAPPPHHLPQEHKAEVKALMKEQGQPSTNTSDVARQHSIQTQGQDRGSWDPCYSWIICPSVHPSQPRAGQGYAPCKAQALPSNKRPALSVKGHDQEQLETRAEQPSQPGVGGPTGL